jgi:hypothetical protein
MSRLGGAVAIIGTGTIKFGENFHLRRQLRHRSGRSPEPLPDPGHAGGGLLRDRHCHDCFTITEIVNYEDLGFFEPGAGWRAVKAGETRLGGSLPVNTSGGLKSCGHPIGSSGIRMINNIHDQLVGRAGRMQVPRADMGLAHNLGGPGSVSAVAVLSRP